MDPSHSDSNDSSLLRESQSQGLNLTDATHAARVREVNIETCIFLLVQAMGGAVVFDSIELIKAYDDMKSGRRRLVVEQYTDPWQLKMKVVEGD